MRDFFADIDWDRWSEEIWTSGLRVILVIAAIYVGLRVLQRILGPAIRATVSAQMQGEPEVEVESVWIRSPMWSTGPSGLSPCSSG